MAHSKTQVQSRNEKWVVQTFWQGVILRENRQPCLTIAWHFLNYMQKVQTWFNLAALIRDLAALNRDLAALNNLAALNRDCHVLRSKYSPEFFKVDPTTVQNYFKM